MDKLRAALVFLLTCEALPSDADSERINQALRAAGCDTAAAAYVRRMRAMNLTGGRSAAAADNVPGAAAAAGPSSALAGLAGQSHLLSWANNTFGQGLSSLTKGDSGLALKSM